MGEVDDLANHGKLIQQLQDAKMKLEAENIELRGRPAGWFTMAFVFAALFAGYRLGHSRRGFGSLEADPRAPALLALVRESFEARRAVSAAHELQAVMRERGLPAPNIAWALAVFVRAGSIALVVGATESRCNVRINKASRYGAGRLLRQRESGLWSPVEGSMVFQVLAGDPTP